MYVHNYVIFCLILPVYSVIIANDKDEKNREKCRFHINKNVILD